MAFFNDPTILDSVSDDSASSSPSPSSSPDPSSTSSTKKPNRRLKNPLGNYASYNYQLSLYMVTPSGMDLFRSTEAKDFSILNNTEYSYLVAQSGGINNNSTNTAPGFNLDYYIEDLTLKNATAAMVRTATNVTDVTFKIIEPYGFSFIKNLKIARDSFSGYLPQNPTRLPFVLGIGFLGYDENGKLVSGNEQYDDLELDPNNSSTKIFNRHYFLTINSIKFKIDGRATVYDITAKVIDQNIGFGTKKGFINSATSISAKTVGESLFQLVDALNTEQYSLRTAGIIEHPTIYNIEYRGFDVDETGITSIEKATIVEDRDLDKLRSPGSRAESTIQVNDGLRSTYDPEKKDFVFDKISIMQGIAQIIKQSSYMTDALRVVYTSALEPDPVTKNRPVASSPDKNFSWYTLSTRIENGKWDNKIRDFAYNITYIIEKYETPVISNPLANPGIGYYGPHKRYDYWYTGENSEVLEYEQRVDNNYFLTILDPNTLPDYNDNEGPGINPEVPISVTQQSGGDRTGGSINVTLSAQNSVLTDLYDPKSFAEARITILGDPDFLLEDTVYSPDQVYNQFYGVDDFTISANGGQVFIELNFREATDYNYNEGTLSINNQIRFWNYPQDVNIEGISYQVIKVDSTFSSGVFKQVLLCKMTHTFTNPVRGNTSVDSPAPAGIVVPSTGLLPELRQTTTLPPDQLDEVRNYARGLLSTNAQEPVATSITDSYLLGIGVSPPERNQGATEN